MILAHEMYDLLREVLAKVANVDQLATFATEHDLSPAQVATAARIMAGEPAFSPVFEMRMVPRD